MMQSSTRFVSFALVVAFVSLAGTLFADDVKLGNFPRGKWLDVTWQAYWTFGDDTIKLLDVHDAEIYDFAGIVQNMKVTNLPKGGVRLTFDCEQAHRSYLFEKAGATSPMQMVIRQKGSSIAYKMAMPPVSDEQLTDYKEAVIAEKPAEVAKIIASIQDIPTSVKAAQQAEKAKAQTAAMLDVAATADFQQLETLSAEAETQGILDAMIQSLESEAAKPDAPPAVFISLSVLYGRKNLKTQSYAALELAEKAPVPPNVSLNVSLLYGRKKLMAGAPDASAFMVGDIELLDVPAEVPVFLDGVEKGKGSMTLSKVSSGRHVIACEHPDYRSFSEEIELGVGQSRQIRTSLVMKECLLTFSPHISDGKLFVDGAAWVNSVSTVIPPGSHTVEVRFPNNKPIKENVIGIPGETAVVKWVRGEPCENLWNINTYPEGATVSIDGQVIGVAPLKEVSVLATEHTVVCEWPGKDPIAFKQEFLLKSDETRGSLLFTQPFIIPTRTIKIDGKNDDWADVEGLEKSALWPTLWPNADPFPKVQGNYITKALICQDDKYVYWYMEVSDGKPLYTTGCSYWAAFRKDSPQDKKSIELRLENMKGNGSYAWTWKPKIPSNFATSDATYDDMWNDLGSSSSFKVGENFIEARFLKAPVLKVLSETAPVYLSFDTYIEGTGVGTDIGWGQVYFKR